MPLSEVALNNKGRCGAAGPQENRPTSGDTSVPAEAPRSRWD